MLRLRPEANAQDLLESQRQFRATGMLDSGFSVVLQMPTGSGKTWLAEQAIGDVLAVGRRAVYLSPLRALAGELVGRWQERFVGAPVGVFTGDFGGPGREPYPVSFADARVLVMTRSGTWRPRWAAWWRMPTPKACWSRNPCRWLAPGSTTATGARS